MRLEPVDAADQRGLAGSRRPADDDALAAFDAERDVAQDVEIAEPLVDALHVDVKHGSTLVRSTDVVQSGTAAVGAQHPLEALAVLRHGVAEREVDDGDEEIDLDAEAHPPGIHDDGLGGAQQIEESDDDDERRVLEEAR